MLGSGRTARAGGKGTVTSIITKYDTELARQIEQDLIHNREMRPKARTSSPYNTKVALKKRDFRDQSDKAAAPRTAKTAKVTILQRDAGQKQKQKTKKSGFLKARQAATKQNRYENL